MTATPSYLHTTDGLPLYDTERYHLIVSVLHLHIFSDVSRRRRDTDFYGHTDNGSGCLGGMVLRMLNITHFHRMASPSHDIPQNMRKIFFLLIAGYKLYYWLEQGPPFVKLM